MRRSRGSLEDLNNLYKKGEECVEVVRDLVYHGRRIVVVEVRMGGKFPDLNKFIGSSLLKGEFWRPRCNGYVEVFNAEEEKDFQSQHDEITWRGGFPSKVRIKVKERFIGFDSGHLWNDRNIKSKKPDYVENTCRKIVDELNRC